MAIEGRMHFAVRSLQSPSGLEGAFRIHISPEHLEQIGLKVGDLCAIHSDGPGNELLGYGLAWRAADKMGANPKLKPAKMTDTVRAAFGISEGSHINLARTNAKITLANRVVLTDVTPTEYLTTNKSEMEDNKWFARCLYTLVNCEAFTTGVTFDVSAKKGIRKRFYIEHIEASLVQAGSPALYSCNDHTKVQFADSDSAKSVESTIPDHEPLSINTDFIGGLEDKIELLNMQMRTFLNKQELNTTTAPTNPFLIHGYKGTGKSLLLNAIGQAAFRSVIRIGVRDLDVGSAMKTKTVIEQKFQTAIATQPSLILIDDIQELAPADGGLHGRIIMQQIEELKGSRVFLVASCRNPSDLYSPLLDFEYFPRVLELLIPNIEDRLKIMKVLLTTKEDTSGNLARYMSRRTHGFTGKDLVRLVGEARIHVSDEFQRKKLSNGHAFNFELSDNLLDGAVQSQSETHIDDYQIIPNNPYHEDDEQNAELYKGFEVALKNVRPGALKEIFFEKPQVKWTDIGGSRAIRKQFDQAIANSPEDMALLHLRSDTGTLLYGPPGCSKTLTAQAVASNYDLNFIVVKGAELISMYVGESERAVREIFSKARAAAPCVIFFDEIDSIASSRDDGGTKGLNVLTTLLNEMDGFDSLKNVIVLAATNKPDALDPAIMRPGRFDNHIYVGLPDEQARHDIFQIQMRGVPRENFDLKDFAIVTNGYTGAEVVKMCNLAKKATLVRKHEGAQELIVRLEDMEKALENMKPATTKEMLARYEAFAQKE